jgi:hypothetical protein
VPAPLSAPRVGNAGTGELSDPRVDNNEDSPNGEQTGADLRPQIPTASAHADDFVKHEVGVDATTLMISLCGAAPRWVAGSPE